MPYGNIDLTGDTVPGFDPQPEGPVGRTHQLRCSLLHSGSASFIRVIKGKDLALEFCDLTSMISPCKQAETKVRGRACPLKTDSAVGFGVFRWGTWGTERHVDDIAAVETCCLTDTATCFTPITKVS